MKYKPILNLCLLFVFLLMVPVGCDDWTEMEIHDSEINGFKEQNPEQYAAYTQKLRAYKAAKHALVYARLDNAPEVSSSEKDFLRACRTVSIWYPCAMPAVFPGSTVKI